MTDIYLNTIKHSTTGYMLPIITKKTALLGKEVVKKYTNESSARSTNPLDYLNNEFKNIVGLKHIKEDLIDFHSYLEVEKEKRKYKDIKISPIPLHAVFSGPPGTGKTTMARIYGKLCKELGILKKGTVTEVDRSNLVGSHIGETEKQTKEILEKSLGGVLFIDEAYSLFTDDDDGRDYGNQAITTILKFMEDNAGEISIIIAGYGDEIDRFLDSNPGLRSRFTNFYHFSHYSDKDLVNILNINFKNESYIHQPLIDKYMKHFFKKRKETLSEKSFGNGREVRNAFNDLKRIQSRRIYADKNFREKGKDFLVEITFDDIEKLYKKYNIKVPHLKTEEKTKKSNESYKFN